MVKKLVLVLMALFLITGVAMAEIDSQSGGTDIGTASKINFSTGLTATRSGLVTTVVANSNGTAAGITSGTINGAVIGGSTPAAGTFTSLVATTIGSGAAVALTPGATPAIDATLGKIFTITPAQHEAFTTTGGVVGQEITIVVTTSGTNSYNLTFNTGFGANASTLATGATTAKTFVIRFIHNGTSFVEIGRTAAM